jgi:hypothetical protein
VHASILTVDLLGTEILGQRTLVEFESNSSNKS